VRLVDAGVVVSCAAGTAAALVACGCWRAVMSWRSISLSHPCTIAAAGVQAKRFAETGKTAMGLIAAASVAMGMRYVSHFTVYGDLYEYGI
jgi:hypothetical protein